MAVVGDFHRDDFQNIIRDIREKTFTIYFDHLAVFLHANGLGQSYDLIFLLASSFSQYSPGSIQRLQNLWPLARIVMISGSLTEGERRTGMLPPDLIRCYCHQWEIEVLSVFTSFCDRRHSAWGLPLTATDEERLRATVVTLEKKQSLPINSQQKISVIIADDWAMRELLKDWTVQKGFTVESCRISEAKTICQTARATEVLFDVISEDFAETLATVKFLKKCNPSPTRLTVLYYSPRPEEIQQLTQAGADCIVPKPFFVP